MANVQKYTRAASGHLAAHFERRQVPVQIVNESGEVVTEMQYVRFGNQDIDLSRTHLNYNLAPEREQGQVGFIRERTTEARTLKRDDVKVMFSWVVTMPKDYSYIGKDPAGHYMNPEKVERLFFERTYRFLQKRYGGEHNVISAYVHKDENRPHIHFAAVPVVPDPKHGGEKVSAKEVLTRDDLRTFHTDLERHLDTYRDWHFEVMNEATKNGNRTVAELKKETAHQEVLQAQQEAQEASQRAIILQERLKPLEERKKALEGEITALQTQKDALLTSAEVEAVKGEKTILGGLKGVSYREFEAVKRTAAKVDTISAEKDKEIGYQTRRADAAEEKVKELTDAHGKLQTAYDKLTRHFKAFMEVVKEKIPRMYEEITNLAFERYLHPERQQERPANTRPDKSHLQTGMDSFKKDVEKEKADNPIQNTRNKPGKMLNQDKPGHSDR